MCEKPVFKKTIALEEAQQLLEQIRQDRGYPSGYEGLDRLSGGLVKDGVTLLASRPAMGVLPLALNMVSRLSRQQSGTILIFSPCNHSDEITIQLLSIGTKLPAKSFISKTISPTDAAARLSDYFTARKSDIEMNMDIWLSLDDIWEHCCSIPDLRMVVIHPINAICKSVDLFAENAVRDEKEDHDTILRSLQKLSHNLNVPVLCTAYLHRSLERRKNKRPRLDDLKKIGIPAELADQIIFLYRDQYYNLEGEKDAEWIVAKVAQGDVGTLRLDWDFTTGCFTEKNHTCSETSECASPL